MSKAIATDKMSKKMIIPVSKKLVTEVDIIDKKVYACYFKDGLLIVGDPLENLNNSIFAQGWDKGYVTGYDEGYDEGFYDGKEEAFLRGYRLGYDDAIEGNGYHDFTECDCGLACDYECEHCRNKNM